MQDIVFRIRRSPEHNFYLTISHVHNGLSVSIPEGKIFLPNKLGKLEKKLYESFRIWLKGDEDVIGEALVEDHNEVLLTFDPQDPIYVAITDIAKVGNLNTGSDGAYFVTPDNKVKHLSNSEGNLSYEY